MIVRMTMLALGTLLAATTAQAADTAAAQTAGAPAVTVEGAGATAPSPNAGAAADRSRLEPGREESDYYATPPDNDAEEASRTERTHGLDDTARDEADMPEASR
ncbi:hypothetical protein [Salinisphaera sp.]|uniref:hypothetical protein n=1 Tax=Salinisphaera sp. TaxID=1914330 RepID=UPI000C36FCD2|nr:hypothetical protein [Salinisphaera sp.]MBS62072.1 hypothetical protein [Salinisphaera sp.]